jgi:TrmH family RNA methyltransferase
MTSPIPHRPAAPEPIASRQNPRYKALRKLLGDPAECRRQQRAWLEGDHLCRAYLARGGVPLMALVGASARGDPALRAVAQAAPEVVVLADGLMSGLSALESPPPIGFVIALPQAPAIRSGVRSVVLDRLQDPGNVGSLMRSASALGYGQVLALQGTVSLWSPKVLRAGMGAHFGLHLVEGVEPDALAALGVPLVAAHLRDAVPLDRAPLPDPLAWVFGHEGQGVADEVAARCAMRVVIPQPGGEESFNVAAAGAICLYESARRRDGVP